MKKYLILLLFNFSLLNAQSDNCDTIVNFGDINICLPNILGLNECLSDPLVKMTAVKRIQKELADIGKNPLSNVSASAVDEKDLFRW